VPINDIPWKKSRTSNLLVSTELDLSGANTSHASSSSKISPSLAARISKFNNLSQSEFRSQDAKKFDKTLVHNPKGNVALRSGSSLHVPFSTHLHLKSQNAPSSIERSLKDSLFEEKFKVPPQSTLHYNVPKVTLESSSHTDKKLQLEKKSPDRSVKMKMIANGKSPVRCKSSSKINTHIQSEDFRVSLNKNKSFHNDSQIQRVYSSELRPLSSSHRAVTSSQKFGQQQMNNDNDNGYFQKNVSSLQKCAMDSRARSSMSVFHNEQRTWDNPIRRRLFSSIAIPIQTEFRRFRGKQRALKRMIALIVIQTWLRRCISYYSFMQYRIAAIEI